MPFPKLTHLQFFILLILMDGERPGKFVREKLKTDYKKHKTLAAFYQFMVRLEEAKLVKGRYVTEVIGGQTIKTRHYEMTGHGSRAYAATRDWYLQAETLREGLQGGQVNA